MAQSQNADCCFSCTHFRNTPEYLETVYTGLKTMSSGHASVRKDDGICQLHDLYLSADAHCDQFQRDGEDADSIRKV
jgi:hypothetical protein